MGGAGRGRRERQRQRQKERRKKRKKLALQERNQTSALSTAVEQSRVEAGGREGGGQWRGGVRGLRPRAGVGGAEQDSLKRKGEGVRQRPDENGL